MNHAQLIALIDRLRAYCPVPVQDEADAFFTEVRQGLTPGLLAMSEPEDPEAKDPEPELRCPHCGEPVTGETQYIEDICNSRKVDELVPNDTATQIVEVEIDGYYETEHWDDGDNGRLYCVSCDKPFAIPPDLEITFT